MSDLLERTLAGLKAALAVSPDNGPLRLQVAELLAELGRENEAAEAAAAGFSPSKSIWPSGTAQFYHWWTVHGKDSHWAWIYEAEEFDLTTREVLQYLLAADLERWPFPWSSFALKALPREIPSRDGGHNPRLWQAPFHRKPTPLDAPSEMRNQTSLRKAIWPGLPTQHQRHPSRPECSSQNRLKIRWLFLLGDRFNVNVSKASRLKPLHQFPGIKPKPMIPVKLLSFRKIMLEKIEDEQTPTWTKDSKSRCYRLHGRCGMMESLTEDNHISAGIINRGVNQITQSEFEIIKAIFHGFFCTVINHVLTVIHGNDRSGIERQQFG